MNQAIWWLIAVLIVLAAAGGLVVYRSTAPDGDVVPEGTPNLEDRTSPPAEGQFLQLEPSEGPPVPTPTPTAAAGAVPAASPSGQTATISMTDTGFVPATVSVSAGTTVRFVNDGQAQHWPASAVHPTHDILPEFDSKRGVATGETYSHTFTKAGSWNFHDHLNPSFTGTVTVR
jgi:plastocyanin